MSLKLIFRTSLFLLILFIMLYVGMTNVDDIPFRCPHLSTKPIVQPAAIIYFIIFAVGVFAGTLFNVGGCKSESKGGKPGKGK